jgi:cytochrome c-type biogenesis protein CcmH/NrfG
MSTETLLRPPARTSQQQNLAAQIAQIEKDPTNVAAWERSVLVLLELGKFQDAAKAQKQVIALSPGEAEPWSELGRIQILGSVRGETVLESLDRALQEDPTHHKTRIRRGMYLLHQARVSEAGASFAQVLKFAPEHMDARAGAALVLDRQGDAATAWTLLAQTTGRPTTSYAIACATVALHNKNPAEAIPVVKRCLKNAVGHDEALMHYSLGDLQDAAGRYGQAWRSWELGNKGRNLSFDRRAHDRAVQALVQLTPGPLEQVGPTDPRPVFVVGMPRSGTTLLETVLNAHSGLTGIGESHALTDIVRHIPKVFDKTSYLEVLQKIPEIGHQLGAAYLEELDREAPGARRVIDKMPNNALHLAVVSCILPGARVIWCERNEDDVAVSCFQKSLGAGLPWAANLGDIRCWQRNLRKLKAHWEATLPLQILTVHYEDMVGDPETQARRIAAFLDVPFELGMLEFHKTRRHVATASFDQVNEAIHTRSVGRSERFRAFLD